jgi:hypothetical protein
VAIASSLYTTKRLIYRAPAVVEAAIEVWLLKIGRTRARDIHADSVQPGPRAEVKCFAVFIAPGDVVRIFRADDCAEVFSFGRNDPESARSGRIKIALHIDFQAIPGVLTRLAGDVQKYLAIGKRAVWMN